MSSPFLVTGTSVVDVASRFNALDDLSMRPKLRQAYMVAILCLNYYSEPRRWMRIQSRPALAMAKAAPTQMEWVDTDAGSMLTCLAWLLITLARSDRVMKDRLGEPETDCALEPGLGIFWKKGLPCFGCIALIYYTRPGRGPGNWQSPLDIIRLMLVT